MFRFALVFATFVLVGSGPASAHFLFLVPQTGSATAVFSHDSKPDANCDSTILGLKDSVELGEKGWSGDIRIKNMYFILAHEIGHILQNAGNSYAGAENGSDPSHYPYNKKPLIEQRVNLMVTTNEASAGNFWAAIDNTRITEARRLNAGQENEMKTSRPELVKEL